MRNYPAPNTPKLSLLAPEQGESIDRPGCNEHDGGKCAMHGLRPSLLDDPDKTAEDDSEL